MPERLPPPERLAGLSLDAIARAAEAGRRYPVERWDPPACGDSGMRIARDGGWWHEGAPIARPAMVRLFAGLLRREDDGGYVLVTPVEKLRIAVEDLPFVAVELASEGDGPARRLAFRLGTGEPVVAGPGHPLSMTDGLPALAVRGGLLARLARPVFYELAELALAEGGDPPGIWSDGAYFPLAEA